MLCILVVKQSQLTPMQLAKIEKLVSFGFDFLCHVPNIIKHALELVSMLPLHIDKKIHVCCAGG